MPGSGNPVKEAYFTPGNIDSVAAEMLSEVAPRGRIGFVPERSALLVIDMQRYFLDETSHAFVPSSRAIVPGMVRLIGAFRGVGRPVLFTRHHNTPSEAGLMMEWWGDVLELQDPLSEIIPELDGMGAVIAKSRYDAFIGTDLESRLSSLDVDTVVMVGVMTHLCCESTARTAFMKDLKVFFAVDGNATYNRDLHMGSLRGLAHGFATPVLVDDIIGRMSH